MPKVTELTPAPNPQSDSTEQFSQKAAAFVAAQVAMVPEINAVIEEINALADGGVYSIPYIFDATTTDSDPTSGKLRLSSATQNAATTIRLDLVGSNLTDYTGAIDTFDSSTSAVKGQVKLTKQGDTTKFLLFDLTARATNTGYRNLTVTPRAWSSVNPFVAGDSVLLSFQRNGDKGQTGTTGAAGANAALALLGFASVYTAVASINFLNVFTSACDTYRIEIEAARASANDTLIFQLAVAGAVDTSSNYSASAGTSASTTYVRLATSTTGSASHTLTIRNANSTLPKGIGVDGAVVSGTTVEVFSGPAVYIGASSVTGFRLSWLTGANFAGGIVRVYGISNT